jgi:hypothetical protein
VVNLSLQIFCVKKKWENEACERFKWLKGEKPEGLEDALVIWIW